MTKENINREIAELLGARAPHMSTGSTESKALFALINERLCLGLDISLTKPVMARAIAEIGGQNWSPNCESRGGTVTKAGLLKVLEAVKTLLK